MAIALVGEVGQQGGDSGTASSATITIGRGTITNGNVLIAILYAVHDTLSNTVTSWTAPSGWTIPTGGSHLGTAVGGSIAVMTHVVAGGEPSTWNFLANFSASGDNFVGGVILEYSGVGTTNPVEVVGFSDFSTGTALTSPSVSPSGSSDMLLVGFFSATSRTTSGSPSGPTLEAESLSRPRWRAFDIGLSSSGATATYTQNFTSSGSGCTVSLALAPPSGTSATVTGVPASATVTGVAGTVSAGGSASITGVAAALSVTGVAGTVTGTVSASITGVAAALTNIGSSSLVQSGALTTPAVSVQLDLAGSAFGVAFHPTDVTPSALAGFDFSPVTVTWGRQDQYSQVQPTTVSGAFRNLTGDLTPGRAASPYYPNIRRGLHRRISVLANLTSIPISDDFATTLTADATNPTLWTTEIEGSDLLLRYSSTPSSDIPNQRFAGTTLRSFIVEEMLLDNPIALYLFQEAEGAQTFSDVTGNNTTGLIHNSTFGPGYVDAGQDPIPPANGVTTTWYGGTFTQITNPAYLTWKAGDAAGSWIGLPLETPNLGGSATACTFELWVSTFPKKPKNYAVFVNGHESFSIWMARNGTVNFGNSTVNPPVPWGTGPNIADGDVHQVAISWDGNTTLTAYVDGVSVATSSTRTAPTSTHMNMGFGPGFTAPVIGGVAYWAMYNRVLSATRINSHYHAGADAFVGETTAARIARLLSYRPNYGSVLDAGTVTMGVQNIQGRSLTDCLLEVGETEGGAVFVDGLGRVNFRARSRLTSPSITLTLNCLAGDVMLGGSFREDDQGVVNDVTVSTPSGSDQRFYDLGSISKDGYFATSVSVPLETDAQALALATWMVGNGILPQLTFSNLQVNLLTCPAATAAGVLSLKPLDIVQVTNIDVNATRAPSTTMTFVVQGGTLSLGMDAMTATINVTPLKP